MMSLRKEVTPIFLHPAFRLNKRIQVIIIALMITILIHKMLLLLELQDKSFKMSSSYPKLNYAVILLLD